MPDIAAKLFPNPTTMIVQLCSTAIMLLLFKKYLWNYVLEFFQKRADFIEGNINDAKAKNEKASEYLLESEKQAKEAAKQYKEIIDQAKEDAVKAKSKIMDEANKQAQEKIEQARHEIESEKLAAQDEMKKEIVDVAVEVATKVMDQNMNTEANKALVDDFVNRLLTNGCNVAERYAEAYNQLALEDHALRRLSSRQ